MLAHVGDRLQANRGIGSISRHLITIISIDNNHRILAHQITGVKLVAAIIAGNIAREVAVRLLERTAIGKLVQVDRRTLQERALLRIAHKRVERNRHTFGIILQGVLRNYGILTVFAIGTILTIFSVLAVLTVGAVQHNADAIAIAHNLEARTVLEFHRLAGIVAHHRDPVAVDTDAGCIFVFHEGLLAFPILGALGKVFSGIGHFQASLVDDGLVAASYKKHCGNPERHNKAQG